MNVLIEDIITECAQNNITVELHYNWTDKQLQFSVHIGSKTGNAIIYNQQDEVWIVGRYARREQLHSFNDLVSYAYGWFIDYMDRSPFEQPDSQWASIFEAKGLIKKVVKTEYKLA